MKKLLWSVCLVLPLFLAGCNADDLNPSAPDAVVLPVIFHILYEDAGDPIQYPSDNLIQSRINQLNAFYAATFYPTAESAAANIQFVAATHAPDGSKLAVAGVNRVQYTGSTNMSSGFFLSSPRTLSAAERALNWNQNQYINIWVFGFRSTPENPSTDETNVSGVAHLPYSFSTAYLEGLVNDKQFYYATNLPAYMHGIVLNNRWFSVEEGMKTLFHEVGHYIGLFHSFIETNKTCTVTTTDYSDDYCNDTPAYSRADYVSNLDKMDQIQRNFRTNCAGVTFRATNVMDYFYGSRDRITTEQVARIEHVCKYSPLIPRNSTAAKALMDKFVGEIGTEIPTAVTMQ